MGRKLNIIIADNNQYFCQMLQQYFYTLEDINTVSITADGLEAWELIQTQDPDLIILDAIMPNLDGINILENVNTHFKNNSPKIIMTSPFEHESLIRQAMALGVDYFILKPFSLDILCRRIRSLTQDNRSNSSTRFLPVSQEMKTAKSELNLAVELTEMMHQIGIPAHLKGYQYIREAVLMVVEDAALLGAVTKELYPRVAKKFGTESRCVERGIRHAIGLAWGRGNTEFLNRLFEYSLNYKRQKPKNSEFIALLAVKLRVMRKVS